MKKTGGQNTCLSFTGERLGTPSQNLSVELDSVLCPFSKAAQHFATFAARSGELLHLLDSFRILNPNDKSVEDVLVGGPEDMEAVWSDVFHKKVIDLWLGLWRTKEHESTHMH